MLWSLVLADDTWSTIKYACTKLSLQNMYYTSAGIMSLYGCVSSNYSGFDPVLCALGPSFSSCGAMALDGSIVQVPWTGPPSSIRWRAFCVHESQPVLHHCIIWSNKRYYFSLQALLLTCNHLIVQKFLTPKWHFYILSITRIVCEQKMSII